MADDSPDSGVFQELSREDCEDYLRSAIVGRLAYIGSTQIEILPINYLYHDGAVVLRTSPYGPLAALARGSDGVAFEIDHHDDLTQSGWSVVVHGRIAAITETAELAALSERARPNPWAAGTRTLYLRIEPTSMTGRQVRAAR